MAKQPVDVLIVGRDEDRFGIVAWAASSLGLRSDWRGTASEAIEALSQLEVAAIVLDPLVPIGTAALDAGLLPGHAVWTAMTREQQESTLVLSLLPLDVVVTSTDVPANRFFARQNLNADLPRLYRWLGELCGRESVLG